MEGNAYLPPNYIKVGFPIIIDEELCSGCNSCVGACRGHLILPDSEKGKPPELHYAEECWLCGCCAEACPEGAITLKNAIYRSVGWKRKETGEYYRIGMKNPPSPNSRPPVY
jgi:NAD-dependent dihydropyrimidine dehydrogenase PreA subunit